MTTLVRFAWRELFASKWRFALLAGILATQTSALGGGSIAFDSLFYTRDHYYDTLHFADLRFQFRASSPEELPTLDALRRVPGVHAVARRFNATGYIEEGRDRRALPMVVHYIEPNGHPKVDDIQIERGSFLKPGDPDGAIVERSFAQARGLSIGDRFVVDPTTLPAEFRVVGIGLSPEYLMPTANPEILIPNRGSLGVVFASSEKLGQLFAEPLYNELSFRFEPGVDRAKTTRAITEALHTLPIERVMPLDSNFGYRYVENILGGSRIFMPMTALLLAAMAAVVAIVLVSRLISSRRRELGALMAQGYSARGFVAALLLLGVVPAAVGGLFGVPGAMAFAKGLAETNASIAGLPAPIMIYPFGRLLEAAAAALAVGIASVLISSAVVLRTTPLRMLRNEAGTPSTPKRFGSWLASLSPAIGYRYAARNVSRRVGLSLSAALLVALAIAMPGGMLTAMSSWDIWARDAAMRLGWDAAVSFKVPLPERSTRTLLDIPGVHALEPWVQGYATLGRSGSTPKEMRVVGLAVPAKLQALTGSKGQNFSAPDAAEIIFNTSFLRGAPAPALGDAVTLTFDGRTERLTVIGLVSDASIATVFIPVQTAQRLFDQPGRYSGCYLAFDTPSVATQDHPSVMLPTDVETIERAIFDHESISTVQLKRNVEQAMLVYLHGFNAVVAPFVLLAGVLGFLFLLSVLSLVTAEREVEYATLRSMGYSTREISAIVLTELAFLVLAGLCLSVLAWFELSTALRNLMALAWFWIPISLRASDYATISIPVLMFVAVASVPSIMQLLRARLSSVLREHALG